MTADTPTTPREIFGKEDVSFTEDGRIVLSPRLRNAILDDIESAPSPTGRIEIRAGRPIESLIETLNGFAQAYPLDVFRENTKEERELYGDIISSAAAAMGRHMSKYTALAAAAMQEQAARIAELEDMLETAKLDIEAADDRADIAETKLAAAEGKMGFFGDKIQPVSTPAQVDVCEYRRLDHGATEWTDWVEFKGHADIGNIPPYTRFEYRWVPSTPAKVDRESGIDPRRWRLLITGDIVQVEDEFLQADAVTWVKATECRFTIGMTYNTQGILNPARRLKAIDAAITEAKS